MSAPYRTPDVPPPSRPACGDCGLPLDDYAATLDQSHVPAPRCIECVTRTLDALGADERAHPALRTLGRVGAHALRMGCVYFHGNRRARLRAGAQ